ncbi:MAG: glycosyl hydrolase-related protein [Kiritimatiellaeota bacterium]|nr:glycosyl hydrolase-related protein [Kiritimatiellota bacterium]
MSEKGMKRLEKLYISKIRNRIGEINERFIWTKATPVTDFAVAETMDHLPIAAAKKLRYRPAKDGLRWGKPWSTAWFRLRIRIPAAFKGETVTLRFLPDGECIIFRDDKPVQGLDRNRGEYILFDRAGGGERLELYVEAGANAAFGDYAQRLARQPELLVFNREVWDAFWDLSALYGMIDPTEKMNWLGTHMFRSLPENDTRRSRIIFALNKAVDLFDYGNPSNAELRSQARKVRRALQPVYGCEATASAQTIACFGHAHIDVAWLWSLAETMRKCGRTFSNVLELMDRYPEFKFVQSQPQLYEYTRQKYPALYERIRQKVKTGQWVPTGAMWVEPDCNVTSGESLVRQILFGTRFFKAEFNYDVADLWLPDVFGYSAALPQILQRSGIECFLTQKISWSQFSSFPYHSFHWEGIDGTRVLTHFPPADDYNSRLEAAHMITAANDYHEKDRCSIQAVPFGFGDGGGGPNRPMLERMRRYRNLEGMPKLEPMAVKEFFRRLRKESSDLPRWIGALYLEMHRGTYTTQADNKKFNRRAELLLRDAEMLSALGSAQGDRYDQKTLNAAWKLVLLNQFHDIIPGSSIDEVYADSYRQYDEIFAKGRAVKDRAVASLAARIDTRGDGIPVLVINSLSWERRDTVTFESNRIRQGTSYVAVDADGLESPVQLCADGFARFTGSLPSVGHSVFHIGAGKANASTIAATEQGMENDLVQVDFDAQGRVRGIFDKKEQREVLERGKPGNRFILFEDKMATCGPAWDMEIYYNDKPLITDGKLIAAKVIERGAVRSVVRFTRAISKSTIRQDVVLTAGSARVDFVTTVEWGDEKDVLLKVAFPVNVRAEKARYEIQFGNVERPTHWNRPQDFGMFEVPAQKWADLSEGNYGVALLNDCKYGHDIRDNVMRLTLLRAPKSPGKNADVNKTHQFTYSILPHAGTYTNGVVRAGYELNVPATAAVVNAKGGRLPARISRMSVSGDNIVIDTVKQAEYDNGIIVRMYEAHGCRGRYEFVTNLPVKRVVETNLMEKEEKRLGMKNGKLSLEFKPFQIVTLKLKM